MENILFSNTPAEELNKLVRTKIAEHLFLICHYEPCVDVFSEDAKFVAGCLNLYKAVIDSSCITILQFPPTLPEIRILPR